MHRIHLDHLASTPLAPEAIEAIEAALREGGNPASLHQEGRQARARLEGARQRAAEAWGCRPRELVFTASGTVAAQLALRGAALAGRERSRRVVLTDIEHPAVEDGARALATRGFDVVRVPPDARGRIDPVAFLDAVGADAAVAACTLANHETGMRQPVEPLARALRERGVPFLVDACLGPGRVPTGRAHHDADLVALSAHKFGGPPGIGMLVVRKGTRLDGLWNGGVQEERLHPGTPAVALAAGAAVALDSALRLQGNRAARYSAALDAFLGALARVDGWHRIGDARHALPGVAALELPRIEGEAAMINLDLEGVAVATGSACASGATEPARTLLAMGFSRARAANTLRISTGEGVGEEDAARAGARLADVVDRLRALGRR